MYVCIYNLKFLTVFSSSNGGFMEEISEKRPKSFNKEMLERPANAAFSVPVIFEVTQDSIKSIKNNQRLECYKHLALWQF